MLKEPEEHETDAMEFARLATAYGAAASVFAVLARRITGTSADSRAFVISDMAETAGLTNIQFRRLLNRPRSWTLRDIATLTVALKANIKVTLYTGVDHGNKE